MLSVVPNTAVGSNLGFEVGFFICVVCDSGTNMLLTILILGAELFWGGCIVGWSLGDIGRGCFGVGAKV